jgi:hypothetical protein
MLGRRGYASTSDQPEIATTAMHSRGYGATDQIRLLQSLDFSLPSLSARWGREPQPGRLEAFRLLPTLMEFCSNNSRQGAGIIVRLQMEFGSKVIEPRQVGPGADILAPSNRLTGAPDGRTDSVAQSGY